jgi:hypothetical protein
MGTAIKFKIDEYPEVQFESGSMDRESLKGCYFVVKGCLESLTDNHTKNMFQFKKKLSGTISRFLHESLYSERYLQTDSIADSFEYTGFSFSTFEYTLFPKKQVTAQELKQDMNKLARLIHQEQITNNPQLKFYKNLKTKQNG